MESIVEWCFIGTSLCMKSEVWAAWWQGGGTVLAIFVAIAIASSQHRAQLRVQAAANAEAARFASRVCMVFGLQLRRALHLCVRASKFHNPDLMELHAFAVREIYQWSQSINADRLPADAVEPFFSLRVLGMEARAQAEAMPQTATSFGLWERTFEKLRDRVHGQVAALAASLRLPPPHHEESDPFVED